MSEVARQYNILAETLRKGIGGMQDAAIAQGALGLEQKRFEMGAAQQDRAYGLHKDRLAFQKKQALAATETSQFKLKELEAQQKIDREAYLDEPLSEDEFIEDAGSSWPSVGKYAQDYALPKIKEHLGWTTDNDGVLRNRDGTAVTRREGHGRDVIAIIAAEGRGKQLVAGLLEDVTLGIEDAKKKGNEDEIAMLVGERDQLLAQQKDMDENPVKYAQQDFNHTLAMLEDSDLDDELKKAYMKRAESNLEFAWRAEIAAGTKANKNKTLKPYYVGEKIVGHIPVDRTLGTGAPPVGTSWGPEKGGVVDPQDKEYIRKEIQTIDKNIVRFKTQGGMSDTAWAVLSPERAKQVLESSETTDEIRYLEKKKNELLALEALPKEYTTQVIYQKMEELGLSYEEVLERIVAAYEQRTQ